MNHKILAVRDRASMTYLNPFAQPARGVAIRTFCELVNDENHQFGKHPNDYELWELGEFDDQTGKFDLYEEPDFVGVGSDFVTKVER